MGKADEVSGTYDGWTDFVVDVFGHVKRQTGMWDNNENIVCNQKNIKKRNIIFQLSSDFCKELLMFSKISTPY